MKVTGSSDKFFYNRSLFVVTEEKCMHTNLDLANYSL